MFCTQTLFINTGGPRFMRSFYLQIRIYAIENDPYLYNLSSNLYSSLVFLYANLLYASHILQSLSIAYNEVRLYNQEKVRQKNEKNIVKHIKRMFECETWLMNN
jgi:hypothetical protein